MGSSLALGLCMYYFGETAVRALELTAPLLAKQAEIFRPSLSWGFMLAFFSSYAPLLSKIALVPQAIACFSTYGHRDKSVVRQYVLYPAIASVLALTAAGRIATFHSAPSVVPITLATLHACGVVQEIASRMIFPAPAIAPFAGLPRERARILKDIRGANEVRINCSALRGVPALHGFEFLHPSVTDPTAVRRWVVYMGGNGELMEHSAQTVMAYSYPLGANALVFNPRGVGSSLGTTRSAAGMVSDAADAVAHLKAKYNLADESIILFGHSIGGAVAANVVAYRFPGCGLVCDRTFSSLKDAAKTVMFQLPPALIDYGLPALFGDLDTRTAFHAVKHERRLITYHRADQIIRFDTASIARFGVFQPGGADERFVIELSKHVGDPHNVPTSHLTGHDALVRRMAVFFSAVGSGGSGAAHIRSGL